MLGLDKMTEAVVTIATAIVGLAMLAVLVSRKSQTPDVIHAAGSAFSNALGIAEAPVTGVNYQPVLTYPGGSFLDLTGHNNYALAG
jgi:hypothetical protein